MNAEVAATKSINSKSDLLTSKRLSFFSAIIIVVMYYFLFICRLTALDGIISDIPNKHGLSSKCLWLIQAKT